MKDLFYDEWDGKLKSWVVVTLWILGISIFLLIASIAIINYYGKHPCVEYKDYCYYSETGIGVGTGVSSSGQATTGTMMTFHHVYIKCEEKENYPEVYTERRCVKRK